MRTFKTFLVISLIVSGVNYSFAQNNGIAKSLNLYVFPNNEQDTNMQNTDESACYTWAMEQTGYDPMNPTQVVAEKVDTSLDGSAVKGAAKGAVGGAAIGAIAGDAGKGAGIGAVAGGARGHRQKKVGDQKQQEANNTAAAAKSEELLNDYKRAFKVCMEGKGYTIK